MTIGMQMVVALVLTIVIEGAVLLLLGEKRGRVLMSSVVINIVTNVPLNLILLRVGANAVSVLTGEVLVVVVETLWYLLFVKSLKRAAIYSVLCNTISFLVGFILQNMYINYILT